MSDEIERCVAEALKRTNELLPASQRVPVEPSTVIAGDGSALESLSLVNFALFLEEELSERTGTEIGALDLLVEASGKSGAVTMAGLTELIRSSGK